MDLFEGGEDVVWDRGSVRLLDYETLREERRENRRRGEWENRRRCCTSVEHDLDGFGAAFLKEFLVLSGERVNLTAFFDGLANAGLELESCFVNSVSYCFFYHYTITQACCEF